MSCSPSIEERVRGEWVGDVESTIADPVFARLADRPSTVARGIVGTMVSRVTVNLGENTCSYGTVGKAEPWACKVVREEPHNVVVYHVEMPEGRRVMRVQPTENGLELSWWDGRKLSLRRP